MAEKEREFHKANYHSKTIDAKIDKSPSESGDEGTNTPLYALINEDEVKKHSANNNNNIPDAPNFYKLEQHSRVNNSQL